MLTDQGETTHKDIMGSFPGMDRAPIRDALMLLVQDGMIEQLGRHRGRGDTALRYRMRTQFHESA